MAKDFAALADDIVDSVGGLGNIRSARHCATRLRMELRDETKAATERIKGLDGVVTVVQAGGQYQVVLGNDVPHVYARLADQLEGSGVKPETGSNAARVNLVDRFIELVSSIFHPILWPLAGAGLFKAFLTLFVSLGWVSDQTTGYVVLNAASDSLIYFMPILLAIPAAKRFLANQYTSVAIAGALVYPSVIELDAAGGPQSFYGVPLVMMSYVSSVIPIIVGVWLQGHLERFLIKTLPGAVRNFMTPLFAMLVMVPLILLTVGPVTTLAANGIAGSVDWLFAVAPWAAGAVMGGMWQVFVMFGLHWGLIPIILLQLSQGQSIMAGPVLGAVLAQAAAALAVMVRTSNAETKKLAGPSVLSGFLAGITEPAIYGINLPRKLPFYFGIVGGAVGGVLAGLAGARTTAFVFPSLIGIPAYLDTPNLPLFFIGAMVSIVTAFVLTYLFGVKDPVTGLPVAENTLVEATRSISRTSSTVGGASTTTGTARTDATATGATTAPVGTTTAGIAPVPDAGTQVDVAAPMSGRLIPLTDMPDPVFSGGAMGAGVGILPSSGTVHAPIAGKVVVAVRTGHAYGIRSDEGVEVLVHVGFDTVNMKGEGFTQKVARGDRVEAGQVLAEVDLGAVDAAGYSSATVVVITNTAKQREVSVVGHGHVEHGQTAIVVTT